MSVFGQKDMAYIADALSRGKGTWVLTRPPTGAPARNVAVLAVGEPEAIRLERGYVLMLGLTRESLTTLRDLADELLKAGGAS